MRGAKSCFWQMQGPPSRLPGAFQVYGLAFGHCGNNRISPMYLLSSSELLLSEAAASGKPLHEKDLLPTELVPIAKRVRRGLNTGKAFSRRG